MTSEYAKELYTLYPEAFREWARMYEPFFPELIIKSVKQGVHYAPIESFNIRDLYEYFDKLGIIGCCGQIFESWGYSIDAPKSIYTRKNYNSRPEAEKEMFTRCFEIRN